MNISEITMSLLMVALFLLILLLIGILLICIKYYVFGQSADKLPNVAAPRVQLANQQKAAPFQMQMSDQGILVQDPTPSNQTTRTTNWDANRRSYIK